MLVLTYLMTCRGQTQFQPITRSSVYGSEARRDGLSASSSSPRLTLFSRSTSSSAHTLSTTLSAIDLTTTSTSLHSAPRLDMACQLVGAHSATRRYTLAEFSLSCKAVKALICPARSRPLPRLASICFSFVSAVSMLSYNKPPSLETDPLQKLRSLRRAPPDALEPSDSRHSSADSDPGVVREDAAGQGPATPCDVSVPHACNETSSQPTSAP